MLKHWPRLCDFRIQPSDLESDVLPFRHKVLTHVGHDFLTLGKSRSVLIIALSVMDGKLYQVSNDVLKRGNAADPDKMWTPSLLNGSQTCDRCTMSCQSQRSFYVSHLSFWSLLLTPSLHPYPYLTLLLSQISPQKIIGSHWERLSLSSFSCNSVGPTGSR